MNNTLTKKQAKKIAKISATADSHWSDYSQSTIEPSFIKNNRASKK